ncbi:MAG TPA: response regulator transcription factor [Chitinophagaceae bacterium]|nr:response regulator transcription factor [Chitinophagaceae bacterium]
MRNGKPISILLVDNNTLTRDLWSYFLNNDPHLKVIAGAQNIREAIDLTKTCKPQVAVVDINMAAGDGPETIREIGTYSPITKVVAIGMLNIPSFASSVLRSGAMAYVSRKSPKDELVNAIISVSQGCKYICSATRENDDFASHQAQNGKDRMPLLTRRENGVIDLVRKGLPSRIIASQLGISVKTVEAHRYHILKKLNVKNTATLVNFLNIHGM